jgi:AraC-like DNA-binding protein
MAVERVKNFRRVPDADGMTLIRGTALAGYEDLVREHGGDPDELLRAAGIPHEAVGDYGAFVDYVRLLRAVESAARATSTADFGRRLADRQGIEILGAVGAAARSAPTVGQALATFERYLRAYSPAIAVGVVGLTDPRYAFFEFRIVLDRLPSHAQSIELALGVMLRVFRLLLGPQYAAVSVHLPHDALTPRGEYVRYFGAAPRFGEPAAGFTVRQTDLARPLSNDRATHEALLAYLEGIAPAPDGGLIVPVSDLIRRVLPTGALDLGIVADQMNLHPRTLQRRLAAQGTAFAELVDDVRRGMAERYLRDTDITLGHLASELGYVEQSALTRASRRWLGAGPRAHRGALRGPCR